ncbi:uncharacterized protein LOC123703671 [Colias croceus]|uniref:uncharacterized protein LOC123703671 n=1 Tax=Colias crocea TaxID=72248 RepID=UPI001E27B053|nr:uncharacterized protein LOC123703671 [Colias croceus]
MNWFCIVFLVSSFSFISPQYEFPKSSRRRRDAVGSLDIVTNNVQPIHADVKNDGFSEKVLPPRETYYQSLRKSFPLTTTLDLVRAISRLFTFIVLGTSAAIELYPVLQSLYETVYDLINYNKF